MEQQTLQYIFFMESERKSERKLRTAKFTIYFTLCISKKERNIFCTLIRVVNRHP